MRIGQEKPKHFRTEFTRAFVSSVGGFSKFLEFFSSFRRFLGVLLTSDLLRKMTLGRMSKSSHIYGNRVYRFGVACENWAREANTS